MPLATLVHDLGLGRGEHVSVGMASIKAKVRGDGVGSTSDSVGEDGAGGRDLES